MHPSFELINATSVMPLLIVCDHASNHVPPELDDLGLDAEARARHIAWDIGAASVARRLAKAFDATTILTRVSRLVIDPNRDPDDATSIPTDSDGLRVPGNCGIDATERKRRLDAYFHPYHRAIAGEIARLTRSAAPPGLFSVHSFTPSMAGAARPWHIGVLWNRDPRMAEPMIRLLRAHPDGLVVGDNQPYSGQIVAYTLNRHGGGGGLAHCAVEIRQDLVADEAAAGRWAAILEGCLREILDAPELHRIRHY